MLRKAQFDEVARAERIYRGGDLRQMKLNRQFRRDLLAASGGNQTLLGVPQYGLHLFTSNAGEPFQKIIHPRAAFQIREQRLNGQPRSPENPGAADLPRRPFDCRTLAPIKHKGNLYSQTHNGKFVLLKLNTVY